ncbi:Permease, drug/metabolite transporter (DMT) superfamily [Alloalcanivorax dieselolei B5]|uniref:Permease, drug/metabolite transporter (DMT) superfamily n=1 Tax=Alcanivorax dieselolei (strain DSM 16502 / CGMCC 1.3690 / MCCC 1A00001 / B-5) TaxID=930169 RepID=K0CE80_ALCDB|nr:DMT family transporter [Alloalcanivorax dieselolei]AFT71919.1 Permease, drug/metabolite transporter (DMT) superfamily [Alloalcanivorax dieselolei B5]GGK08728.1 permease [Alloalcanivorax dieselolei]
MDRPQIKGTGYAFATSALWGATGIWVALLTVLPVSSTLLFRFVTATVLLVPALLLSGGIRKPTRDGYGAGALLVAYYLFATIGFYFSNVVSVSLLVSTSPFFVMLIRVCRREALRGQEMVGGILAFTGVLVLIAGGAAATAGRLPALGNVCGLGAALTMALYSLIGPRLQGQGWTVVLISCLLGALISLPFSVPTLTLPDWPQWGLFAGLALFSTLAPGYLYPLACQRITPTAATVIRLSTPFFTAFFAWLILEQTLGLHHLLGAPLMLAGVYLTLPRSAV